MLLLLQDNIDVKKDATITLVECWNKEVGILGIQSLWKLLKVTTPHVKPEQDQSMKLFVQSSAEMHSAVLLGMWLVSKACFL